MIRFFRVFVPVGALALLFSEILLVSSCFLLLVITILNVDPAVFLFADNGLLRIAIVVASILFGLFFEDLYAHIHVKSRILLLQQLCLVVGIALLIQGIISYVNEGFRLPVRIMLPGSVLVILALFGWRTAYGAFVLRVVGAQRVLFVGAGPMIEQVSRHIEEHPEMGMQIVGYVEDGGEVTVLRGPGKVLGPLSALQEITAAVKPDRIVVGFAERRRRMPVAGLLQLRYGGQAIEEAGVVYEQLSGRVPLRELRPSHVVFSAAFRPRPDRLVYQTMGNWLLALFLAILSAPLLLLTAVLVRISSRGPLLARRTCVGFGGRSFTLHRFRLSGSARWIHRFVRRWRLDALPHLWSLLRGDICFVGPRAERPEFARVLEDLIPFYRQRYRVKPGLTGWSQINMPAGQPLDTMRSLEFDFYYLKNFSRGLDTYILVHTVKSLFISRTAA